MRGLGFQRNLKSKWKLIFPSIISCIFVIISQFTLSLIPRYFPSFPLLAMLLLLVLLLLIIAVISRIFKRLLRIYASAPAFVFFSILFIWVVHIFVIRKAIPVLIDIIINTECALLMVGFYSILYSDPGWVAYGDSSSDQLVQSELSEVHYSEEENLLRNGVFLEKPTATVEEDSFPTMRVRYCKICKAHIRGFDHHCPAFGNCIGQKNHLLFMVLLFGFIMVEASYIVCSNQFITKSKMVDGTMLETTLSGNLAISTLLFVLLQVLWKVIFLIWHIYCVCVNIRTDEWINWKKYPEFQLVQPQAGQSFPETTFVNPYDKGVLGNTKSFYHSGNKSMLPCC